MGFTGLRGLLSEFPSRNILVVGDLMLDEYCRGHVERISPEAPVPVLVAVGRDAALGGAGNVVQNLRGLGVRVTTVGVVGEDITGDQIHAMLGALGADGDGIVRDPGRVSTRKVRFVSLEHGQQVFRLDEESTDALRGITEERIRRLIQERAPGTDAILCSDYRKGVLTERILRTAFHAGRENAVPVIVAPKDPILRKYKGASILMPNLREFQQLSGKRANDPHWMWTSAGRMIDFLGLEALLVTKGSQGMTLFEGGANGLCRVDLPTVAKNVFDVTGAGDTAIAAFAAALASNASHETAARLANVAAGIVVGKRGTASVSLEELENHLAEQHAPIQVLPIAQPHLRASSESLEGARRVARNR